MFLQPTRSECKILGYSFVSSSDVWVFNTPSQVGMEQAWVGQKTGKCNILRVFKMSNFINI